MGFIHFTAEFSHKEFVSIVLTKNPMDGLNHSYQGSRETSQPDLWCGYSCYQSLRLRSDTGCQKWCQLDQAFPLREDNVAILLPWVHCKLHRCPDSYSQLCIWCYDQENKVQLFYQLVWFASLWNHRKAEVLFFFNQYNDW